MATAQLPNSQKGLRQSGELEGISSGVKNVLAPENDLCQ